MSTEAPPTCGACGTQAPSGFRFCGACGARLAPDGPATPSPPAAPAPPAGDARPAERRHVTVMFCDLVGSTALSAELDPEVLLAVVRSYQAAAIDVVGRFEGHVAQYLGDGILVYFGFPHAQERDPQRAVLSGLAIVEAVDRLNADLQERHGVRLAVRVGIHSGLVVAGEVGAGDRTERLALGQTPNIAARLQSIAEPGSVVVSSQVRDLVKGFIEVESLGTVELKGLPAPVEAFRAVAETGLRSGFEVAERGGLSPLVGRSDEVATLLRCFDAAMRGHGQVALVAGEAGIGKSRLVQALKAETSSRSVTQLTCRCSPYHQKSALNPVIELLQRLIGFKPGDPPADRLRALEEATRAWGIAPDRAVPLLASLLSVPLGPEWPPLNLSPQRQARATLELLRDLILRGTDRAPVLVCVEDLHWVDASTLEFLDLLVEGLPRVRALVVFTFRPTFESKWVPGAHVTRLDLDRLDEREAAEIARAVAGGVPLAPPLVAEILRRTDGIPLFVEELTRMLVDTGAVELVDGQYRLGRGLPANAIPVTLQDSLAARLDRLPAGKDIAQLGAVLGRQFGYPLLRAVAGMDDRDLQRRLAPLVAHDLIHQRAEPPESTYRFKHALLRDAAYESLLRAQRQDIHARVGRVIEASFPDVAEAEPELLAHHYELAGDTEKAIEHSVRAGHRALSRWAHADALHHFGKALELLALLPRSEARDRRELEYRAGLGVALITTRGYSAPDVQANYGRAADLCRRLGDTPFPVRFGIWAVHVMQDDRVATAEMAPEFERILEHETDPRILLMSHAVLGGHAFYRGHHELALSHLGEAVARFRPEEHRRLVGEYGGSGGFYGHTLSCWVLCHLGRVEEAVARYDAFVPLAESLNEPYTLAEALTFAFVLAQDRDEPWRARRIGERVVALSVEQGLFFTECIGRVGLGWALARAGEVDEGLEAMRSGLAAFRATGTRVIPDYYQALYGHALLEAGRADEALAQADELLAVAREGMSQFNVPQLLRLRGEALAALGDEQDAELALRSSLDVARKHGARLPALRAATSLGGLLRDGGRSDEGRRILGEALHAMPEGRDTGPVRRATELLSALGRPLHEDGWA